MMTTQVKILDCAFAQGNKRNKRFGKAYEIFHFSPSSVREKIFFHLVLFK
jgi:hypothetical protein